MGVAYGQDLRDRILGAYSRGMKTKQIAELFQVSSSWARRVKQRLRESGETSPRPRGGATVIKIEFIRGSNMGMVFRAPEGGFEIGRDVLSPRDCRISHRHFRVECVNGTAFIADAGSTNGTLINGRFASPATLLEPDAELVIAGNKAVYRRH